MTLPVDASHFDYDDVDDDDGDDDDVDDDDVDDNCIWVSICRTENMSYHTNKFMHLQPLLALQVHFMISSK